MTPSILQRGLGRTHKR